MLDVHRTSGVIPAHWHDLGFLRRETTDFFSVDAVFFKCLYALMFFHVITPL